MARPAPKILAPAILALALMPEPAAAQEVDFLVTEGKLLPDDFYRLVACRAMPGGPCSVDAVRWSPEAARALAVRLAPVPPAYPPEMARAASRALDVAIDEINAAGAALRLARAPKSGLAPITLHLAPVREGDLIAGTGVDGVDGEVIGAALVTVWWDDAFDLQEAVIVVAADLPAADIGPVVLEELTQAMGLMTDIRNPVYEGVSVFSEDSNDVAGLSPQDRDALRRHYPPIP